MQSIRGIYTGKEIKPLEEIQVRPNVRVMITFLDEISSDAEGQSEAGLSQHVSSKSPTQEFLEKCDGWEDTRSVDAIVTEIYEARTRSERGANLFQESQS